MEYKSRQKSSFCKTDTNKFPTASYQSGKFIFSVCSKDEPQIKFPRNSIFPRDKSALKSSYAAEEASPGEQKKLVLLHIIVSILCHLGFNPHQWETNANPQRIIKTTSPPPSRFPLLPPSQLLVSYHGGRLCWTTDTSKNNRRLGKTVSRLHSSGSTVAVPPSISTLLSLYTFTENDQDWARAPLLWQEPANQIRL